MTVEITKPKDNLRDKLNTLRKPSGVAGEAMLRAETPQEQQALIGVGRKNMIINGANIISQRGTVTGINTSLSNYGGPDRRNVYSNSPGASAVFTLSRGATGPSGFPKTCRIDCTTASSSALTGTQEIKSENAIEGYDVQQVGFGTPACKPITISFYVKSNQAANYVLWLYRPDGGRSSSKVYTINSANTWEYKTLTFNPDVSDPVAVDETAGLYVSFIMNTGPGYTSGTNPDGTWEDLVTANRYVGHTATIGESTNDYFEFTGLQVETGPVATPFEHRPYEEELNLCKRYFQKYGCGVPGYSNSAGNTVSFAFKFSPELRAQPTATINNAAFNFADTFTSMRTASGAAIAYNGFTAVSGSEVSGGELQINVGTTTTANMFQQLYEEDAIFFDAEL